VGQRDREGKGAWEREKKRGMRMREGGGAAVVGGEGAFLRTKGESKTGRNGFGIFDGDANRIKGRNGFGIF
jgi:hypothetical protein